MNELNISSYIQIMQSGFRTHDKQESAGVFLLSSINDQDYVADQGYWTSNLSSKKISRLVSRDDPVPDGLRQASMQQIVIDKTIAYFKKEIMPDLNPHLKDDTIDKIVKLIGADVLPDDQKLIIEIARVIRVGFLQQNAFHKDDTFVPLEKQKLMMKAILLLYHNSLNAINGGKPISEIISYGFFDKLVKMKYDIPNDNLEMFNEYFDMINSRFAEE